MARSGLVSIATCQFPVSASVERNARYIRAQMKQARRKGAGLVHFSECALSGYVGTDRPSWDGYDWAALERETREILALARTLKLWVVLGSSHRLSGSHKPHNCLYVITPKGAILTRYDKRFCTPNDLKHYQAGNHFSTFIVNGVTCGLLICYDFRFPELYREYQRLGVQVMFHSFYNARSKQRSIHNIIMRATLQGHAGINYMWVSANNACGYYQQWPSVLIQPDGAIAKSLPQHRASVMVNRIDVKQRFYDASKPFRDRAMRGQYCSGTPVADPRSRSLTAL